MSFYFDGCAYEEVTEKIAAMSLSNNAKQERKCQTDILGCGPDDTKEMEDEIAAKFKDLERIHDNFLCALGKLLLVY